ncbi:RNA-binding protein 33-like [Malaya genurostris]|uniref:RNA-binding protein 33-like n=1 Tax=Malaya genurostris TaxID=325434 RepID=UPI0026F3AFB4|nr:RNA-binding protein 33-like [Malaya genurostris]
MLLIGCVLWTCLLPLVPAEPEVPSSSRPTNLEDIERDNLKSERHLAFKKEAIPPPPQYRPSSSQSNNHYSVQIEHHPGGATSHIGINYVTPVPSATGVIYAKEYPVQYQQKVPQVHEDHSTYTVPSRQSLIQPIIGGSAPASTYQNPQPQYVYVQAQPQQIQPPQIQPQQIQPQQIQPQHIQPQQIQQLHIQPQHFQQFASHSLPQPAVQISPQHQQSYIMIPTTYYQQPHSAQQYAAYANDPNNNVDTYSHGETGSSGPPQPPSGPSAPEAPLKPHGVVYASPSSTPSPFRQQSPSAEFSIVKSVEPQIFLPSDSHLNSGVQYSHSPARPAHLIHHETHTTYPSLTHPNTGILNYLGVHHKAPTSLLDSYVPSSLQLSPIKAFAHQTRPLPALHLHRHYPEHHHLHHQPYQPQLFYQPPYPVSHSAYPVYPSHVSPAISHHTPVTASSYNTIAYSVPLTHTKTLSQYKRSPMLETMAGVRYSNPRALAAGSGSSHAGGATTKLQPAAKLV